MNYFLPVILVAAFMMVACAENKKSSAESSKIANGYSLEDAANSYYYVSNTGYCMEFIWAVAPSKNAIESIRIEVASEKAEFLPGACPATISVSDQAAITFKKCTKAKWTDDEDNKLTAQTILYSKHEDANGVQTTMEEDAATMCDYIAYEPVGDE